MEKNVTCSRCGDELNENVLLPDGTIITCCMDYGMTGIFGNLFEQTYEEVLSSEAAKLTRQRLKANNDNICRHCIYGAGYR